MTWGTRPLGNDESGFVAIGTAAMLTKRSIEDIVGALVDGQLENVRLDPAKHGLAAVRFDVAEINAKLTPVVPFLTLAMVKNELRCSIEAIRTLVERNYLAHEWGRLPTNNMTVRLVRPETVAEFLSEYVSLFSLAREVGRHFKAVKNHLAAHGLSSVFGDDVAATFYRRAEVVPLLAKPPDSLAR